MIHRSQHRRNTEERFQKIERRLDYLTRIFNYTVPATPMFKTGFDALWTRSMELTADETIKRFNEIYELLKVERTTHSAITKLETKSQEVK